MVLDKLNNKHTKLAVESYYQKKTHGKFDVF